MHISPFNEILLHIHSTVNFYSWGHFRRATFLFFLHQMTWRKANKSKWNFCLLKILGHVSPSSSLLLSTEFTSPLAAHTWYTWSLLISCSPRSETAYTEQVNALLMFLRDEKQHLWQLLLNAAPWRDTKLGRLIKCHKRWPASFHVVAASDARQINALEIN